MHPQRPLLYLTTLFVVFWGTATYMMLASRAVEVSIFNLLAPAVHSENLPPKSVGVGTVSQPMVIPSGFVSVQVPGDGVINYNGEHFGLGRVIQSGIAMATGFFSDRIGLYIPMPFLVPFAIHVSLIFLCRMIMRWACRDSSTSCATSCMDNWVLRASIYAFVLVLLFQGTRMFWGSAAWDTSYLVSYEYGWAAFYLLLVLCIGMYLYCVIGCAGLRVRRKPGAKKLACIRCGYELGDADARCPECDLEVGEFIPSRWRINHWYLGVVCVVAFFSPVLVASVHWVIH
jgi:hypothetical protein